MSGVSEHGPLPKIHPRRGLMTKAKNKLEVRLLELIDEHGLTHAEAVWVLANLSSAWARLAVRAERKGDQEDE